MKKFSTHCHPERSEGSERLDSSLTLRMTREASLGMTKQGRATREASLGMTKQGRMTRAKNLLTIIFAALCGALLCCAAAVGGIFGGNKKANAATANATTYNITFMGQHNVPQAVVHNPPRAFSDFGTTIDESISKFAVNGNVFTATKEFGTDSIANYAAFEAEIVVPAYSEYKVVYSYDQKTERHCKFSGLEANTVNEFFYYGNSANGGSDRSADVTYRVLSGSGSPYSVSCINFNYSYTQVGTDDYVSTETKSGSLDAITYSNTTGNAKTFIAYFGFFAGSGCTGGPQTCVWADYEFTINETVTAVTAVGVDRTSANYDASGNLFNFDFTSRDFIKLSSVTFKNMRDAVSTLYNGTGTCPIDAAGECTLTDAGTYTLKFDIDGDGVWKDTKAKNTKTIILTIKPEAVNVPAVQGATQVYKAAEYEFGLNGYDKDIMSVASYTGNPTAAAITWDATSEKFKARDAATYTVKFHLDSLNYVWSVNGGESAEDQAKTVIINKKEIAINATPSANSNPKFGLGESGEIELTATASGITTTEFALNLYYVKEGGTDQEIAGIDATALTLDVSQIADCGKYTLYAELTGAAANRNYKINNDKFSMPFEIESGAINTSLLTWQYKEGEGGSASNLFVAGSGATEQNELRFKELNGEAVKYYILADIPSGSYLSIDTGYNADGYTNGFRTENADGATVQYADKVGVYKTRVVLNTDENHLFKTTANTDRITTDGLKGWYEIEWEVTKGKIDEEYLNNLQNYLQYKTAGGTWTAYDPANPPQYGSGAIEIRLDPAKYPDGVEGAEIQMGGKKTEIGTYTAEIKLTVNERYEVEGIKTFQWEISAQNINVDWTVDYWKDAAGDNVVDDHGVPYQIRVLNIPDNLKQYVEYKYYLADPSNPSQKGTYLGKDGDGLQTLKDTYNASSNNAVLIYVEACIKSGVTQYKLKDTTGAAYPNTTRYELGSSNTLVEVSLTAKEMYYGESAFTQSLVSLLDKGANAQLDQSTFLEGIYVYDSKGENLGLLKDFDGAKAAAGVYTIEIKLNAAGEETYTLAPGARHSFTVKQKAISVPTLGEITFDNTFINLEDYLGGTYAEYKDIIKLGGTFDGVKNAGAYTATLTLTNPNYCWNYGAGATPAKALLKYTLTGGESYSVTGDETVATYEWNIAPYVLETSGWSLKGKDGAVYNLPSALTEGLDVSVNYLYHTDKAGTALEDGAELKAGGTYFVKAQIIGEDAGNFVFKDTGKTTSDFATYKVPQNGAKAMLNSVRGFVMKTWMGLPIWVWLLIGLAVVLFFIFLLILIAHRRKTKEKREEKKAAKEAAKAEAQAKAEAEKERREAEKARLESQREIEKMKAEAEIAKIKAQAQAQAPAPQAMPQPMPMPQMQQAMPQAMPMPAMQQQMPQMPMQPQYQQMPMQPQYQQMPVQQPVQQVQATPVQMPTVMPAQASQADMQAAEARIRAAEERARYAEERIARDAEERARQAEERALRAAEERARLAEQQAMRSAYMQQPNAMYIPSVPAQQSGNGSIPMDVLGALMVSALKSFAANGNHVAPAVPMEKPAELPQTVESDSATVSAQYPPDAVITTTTTVDTTKNGAKAAPRAEDDRERFFDIDGFYDKYEGK